MGRGIVKRLLSSLERAVEKLPDNRKGSNALTYAIGDAVKSARLFRQTGCFFLGFALRNEPLPA
jgi:hypothetical protein